MQVDLAGSPKDEAGVSASTGTQGTSPSPEPCFFASDVIGVCVGGGRGGRAACLPFTIVYLHKCAHTPVCESKERTAVVNSIAKALDLPYVPFRILFVEGTMASYAQDVSSHFLYKLLCDHTLLLQQMHGHLKVNVFLNSKPYAINLKL